MQNESIKSLTDINTHLACACPKLGREDRENFLQDEHFEGIRLYSLCHGDVIIFRVNAKSKYPIYGYRYDERLDKNAVPLTWTKDMKLNESFIVRDLYNAIHECSERLREEYELLKKRW